MNDQDPAARVTKAERFSILAHWKHIRSAASCVIQRLCADADVMDDALAKAEGKYKVSIRMVADAETERDELREALAKAEAERDEALQRSDTYESAATKALAERDKAKQAAALALDIYRTYARQELLGYLEQAGWGPCDIAACNCGGWHKLRESQDERALRAEVARLRKAAIEECRDE